ncbi:MAG: molybdopterin-dependent oxidoreductase [Acidimicrobiia bacterium]
MTPRQTNIALLWLTTLTLISGVGAFLIGTQAGHAVVLTHGVLGVGILVLSPWKSVIARRGLRRARHGSLLSLTLTFTILVAVGTGILQVTGWANRLGPLTLMQAHVGSGVAAIALTRIHYRQRSVGTAPRDPSRRNLIRWTGLLSVAALIYVGTEGLWRLTSAPGRNRRFTGSHEILDVADVPATQWLNDRVQHLGTGHQVTISGTRYRAEEIAMGGDVVTATLDCTGGWYTTQEWSGTSLDRLIQETGGQSIVVRSVTGYWRRFPRRDAPRLLLATHAAGHPLRDGHGGPMRVVADGRRGYWWVKWVESVEVDDLPPWWQPPLPLA